MDTIVRDNQYSVQTISKWKNVWSSICEMCYNNSNIQAEIITQPGSIQIDEELILNASEKDHSNFFAKRYCINDEELILDTVWKEYSKKAGPGGKLFVIPEFRHLHVPAFLFYTLGVNSWFRECFPNCDITFWEV
jgi:hypothetical protein